MVKKIERASIGSKQEEVWLLWPDDVPEAIVVSESAEPC
jgi:hypothetical protein